MYYGPNIRKLEVRLKPFLHDDFFFVNVGANDGVMNDPIYPFVVKHGWRGIAIEPVPHVFAQLAVNYRNLPGVALEQVAIAESSRSFWCVRPGSGSEEFAVQQIGSLKKDYVYDSLRRLRFMPNPGPGYADGVEPELVHTAEVGGPLVVDDVDRFVEEIEVECVPFNELMERHDVDHIDFLNIDAEGSDFEVLSSVDFDRFRPEILCIEVTALSEEESHALEQLLERHDYTYLQHVGIHSHVYAREPTRRTG
jgi:FkbM family methyltransferase